MNLVFYLGSIVSSNEPLNLCKEFRYKTFKETLSDYPTPTSPHEHHLTPTSKNFPVIQISEYRCNLTPPPKKKKSFGIQALASNHMTDYRLNSNFLWHRSWRCRSPPRLLRNGNSDRRRVHWIGLSILERGVQVSCVVILERSGN